MCGKSAVLAYMGRAVCVNCFGADITVCALCGERLLTEESAAGETCKRCEEVTAPSGDVGVTLRSAYCHTCNDVTVTGDDETLCMRCGTVLSAGRGAA